MENLEHNSVDTEFLSIKTHLYLSSIKNSIQFKNGYYNIIGFKGTCENSKIDTFINLCRIHSNNCDELSFWEFFYSLTSLFKPQHEQQFKNLLGLVGELAFMRTVNALVGHDISADWHGKETYSKYDFISAKSNVEVKTIISEEPIVTIKHSQIFNGDKNFLCLVCVVESDIGKTVSEIIEDLRMIPNKFNNLHFNLNIEKELQRISPVEMNSKRFHIRGISLYDVKYLNIFCEIPYEISELQYKYDLGDAVPLDMEISQNDIW